MTLYEIKQSYLEALNSITVDEDTGEVTNMDALLAVQGELDDKCENTALYIKNLSAEITARKAEIDTQKKIMERDMKKCERIESLLSDVMQTAGMDKLKTARCEVKFRLSTAVDVLDASLLPEKYVVQKVTTTPDKKAIKEALASGTPIPGAALIERNNIQIK